MERFGMYVKFTARSEQRDRLVGQLLKAAELAGEAPGCRLYVVNISPEEPDTVWVTEIWDSREAHDASLSAEGAAELIAETMPLLASRPEAIPVIPVGGTGLA
jgi:quinol monooxygenase YgiN